MFAYPDSSPSQLIRIIGVLLYSINVVQTPFNEFLLGKKCLISLEFVIFSDEAPSLNKIWLYVPTH